MNSSFMGSNENIQEADGGVVSPQPNRPVDHGTTQKNVDCKHNEPTTGCRE